MSAFTSLDQVDTPGTPGEYRQLLKATAHNTMIVTVEGSPTACVVYMEGSHDGTRWSRIGTHQASQNGIVSTQPTTHLITHVRAYLQTLTGGTDPKVTVTIASADDA